MRGILGVSETEVCASPRWNASRRCDIIRWGTLLGILAAFAIAPRLWLSHDFFGPISVFGPDHRISFPLDVIFLATMVLLLIPAFRMQTAESWIRIWCLVAIARCAWDRITWQPYLLQYFCMLMVLGWYDFKIGPKRRSQGNEANADVSDGRLHALRLIVLSVYFWSGVSKFNHRFFERAAATFFGPLLPADVVEFLDKIIWMIPVTESLLALGLLTPLFHKVSVVGLVGMHIFISWMIGPLGADFNRVVWPWNLVMIVVLPTLFWNVPPGYPRHLIQWKSPPVHKLVFILCTIMPALSYAGVWPIYLSFRMYSAREPRAEIQFSKRVADELPEHIQKWITWHPQGKPIGRLSILVWADQELGAFVPTEIVAYKHVAKRLWDKHRSRGDMYLNIEYEPSVWTGEARFEQIHCREL